MRSITEITRSGNRCDELCLPRLEDSLPLENLNHRNSVVSYLSVGGKLTALGKAKMAELALVLEENTTVVMLYVSGASLEGSLDPFARLLLSGNKSLKEMTFGAMELKTATPLAKALARNTALIYLNVSSNHIGNVRAFASLARNTTLLHLDLGDNRLRSLTGLVAGLEGNRTLLRLDLRGNRITQETMLPLALVLGRGTGLTWLNLCDNLIKDPAPLARTTLESLNLGGNTGMDLSALAIALAGNNHLRRLGLGATCLRAEALLPLFEVLHQTRICYLDLVCLDYPGDIRPLIAEIPICPCLLDVDLSHSGVYVPFLDEVAHALALPRASFAILGVMRSPGRLMIGSPLRGLPLDLLRMLKEFLY